jgi:hypothetical protein
MSNAIIRATAYSIVVHYRGYPSHVLPPFVALRNAQPTFSHNIESSAHRYKANSITHFAINIVSKGGGIEGSILINLHKGLFNLSLSYHQHQKRRKQCNHLQSLQGSNGILTCFSEVGCRPMSEDVKRTRPRNSSAAEADTRVERSKISSPNSHNVENEVPCFAERKRIANALSA